MIRAELCSPGDVRNFISWHSLRQALAFSTQQHPRIVSHLICVHSDLRDPCMHEKRLPACLQRPPNKQAVSISYLCRCFPRVSCADGSRIDISAIFTSRSPSCTPWATSWLRRRCQGFTALPLPPAALKPWRRALGASATARTAGDGQLTRQRTSLELLLSVGMSREAAEAALRHAAAHFSALGPEHYVTQQESAAPDSKVEAASTDVAQVGAAQQEAVAACVEIAMKALLDAGVPVQHLATVIGEHPAALAANPDAEWKPKVRHMSCAVTQ